MANLLYVANGDRPWRRNISRYSAEAGLRASTISRRSIFRVTAKRRPLKSGRDKGHRREMELTVEAMRTGQRCPYPLRRTDRGDRGDVRRRGSDQDAKNRVVHEAAIQRLWRVGLTDRNPSTYHTMEFQKPSEQPNGPPATMRPLYWVLVLLSLVPIVIVLPMVPTQPRHCHPRGVDRADLDCDQLRARPIPLRRSLLGGHIPILLLFLLVSRSGPFLPSTAHSSSCWSSRCLSSHGAPLMAAANPRRAPQRIFLGPLSAGLLSFSCGSCPIGSIAILSPAGRGNDDACPAWSVCHPLLPAAQGS